MIKFQFKSAIFIETIVLSKDLVFDKIFIFYGNFIIDNFD